MDGGMQADTYAGRLISRYRTGCMQAGRSETLGGSAGFNQGSNSDKTIKQVSSHMVR